MIRIRVVGAFAVLAGTLLLTGCTGTTGSGTVKSESRQVSGFSKVDLSGVGRATIQQTGTESLTILAEDNILPLLTSEVRDGTLELGLKRMRSINPTEPITYRLTVKSLDSVGVSGSGSVSVTGLDTPRLTVDLSGSGEIRAAGNADSQKIDISGSGRYLAPELTSRAVDADISGSGKGDVRASDTLKASISGSGTLTYIGDPRVSQDVSGSGKVIKK